MFRLMKLKPPHGWNAVGWELAIVTLGVLIALAAQQVVQDLHDRSVAAETRKDVTDEINSDLMSLQLRQASEPCIDQRLGTQGDRLAMAKKRNFRGAEVGVANAGHRNRAQPI